MTNTKFSACGILAMLALGACSTAPPKDGTSYDRISSELKAATENRTAREQQQSIVQSLLPPLSVEMPKATPMDLEPRFDLTVTNAPAPQVLNAIVSGTRYSMVVHPAIKEPISLSLKQVTLAEVLNTVREIYGYEYRVDGSLIYVFPASLQTRMYKVDYLTSLRRGSTDMRVSSNAITTPGAPTGGPATPGAPSAGTSTQSTQVGTISSSDFWDELRRTVGALAGCRVEVRNVGGVAREDTACDNGRQVVVSPQSGSVLVRAMPEEHKSISAYLRSSQIAVEKQVLIEAKILEVSLRDGYETGINWAAFFSRQGETIGIGMLTPGTTLGTTGTAQILQGGMPTTGITTPLTAGIPATGASLANAGRALASSVDALGTIFGVAIQTKNFAALMTFLEGQGVVHTLSSPRIATMNNQKAVLKVGADQLFVTKITGGSVTPGTVGVAPTFSSPTFDVQSFFSGIALDVTPRITEDGSIVLHVRPSVSTVNQNLSTFNLGALGTYQIPLVSNAISETDSVIRAQDGQIVAIGGLMRQAQTESRNQVPGLGNLPFAGAAFRNVSQTSEKRELVILLKPTVIHGDDSWGRTIGEPRQRIQAMDRGFSWGGRSEVFGTGAENYTPPPQ